VLYPVELRAQGIKCSAPDAANARLRIRRKRNHAAYSIFTLAAGTHCPAPHLLFGRGRGIRTLDVQLPKLALYQAELYPAVASYRVKPAKHCRKKEKGAKAPFANLARPERFELPTTKFVAWYSIQLSYGREEAELFRLERVASTPA
jgi:hypothetical protein